MRGQLGGRVIISLKIEQYLNEALEKRASLEGVSKSELIRRAVREYLARHPPKVPKGCVTEEKVLFNGYRYRCVYVF